MTLDDPKPTYLRLKSFIQYLFQRKIGASRSSAGGYAVSMIYRGLRRLEPVRKAIATVHQQINRIIQRWYSTHSNARLEGLNAIFQAARHRARGYASPATFIAMIYLLAAPIGDITKSI